MKKYVTLFVLLIALSAPAFSQFISGTWEGELDAMSMKLKLITNFATKDGALTGKISIPKQGLKGFALSNVSQIGNTIKFDMVMMKGNVAHFDGKITGDSIAGDFEQQGVKGKFHLVKNADQKPLFKAVEYNEREVTIQRDGFKLAGTLTTPLKGSNFPAVVLVTGSGLQDRNEELFEFRPFEVIAERLTLAGYAVLRYDDRGFAESTAPAGNDPTSMDYADDALAVVKFLQTQSEINPRKIGIIGHSEGGLVAIINAARSTDVAFAITLGGTAVNGEQILREQGRLIAIAEGATDEDVRKQTEVQQLFFEAIRGKLAWNELENRLIAEAKAELEKSHPEGVSDSTMNVAKMQIKAQIHSSNNKWFKFFLEYDPLPDFEKASCPFFAIYGEKDNQVPAALNVPIIEKMIKEKGKTNYSFEIIPKANHLFLETETGKVSEYATMKKEFVPGFLDEIVKWMNKNVK